MKAKKPRMKTKNLRMKTNVTGLDDLFGGELLPSPGRGLIVLLKGLPGTGKSTLALQIAKGLMESPDLKETLVFTFDQTRSELEAMKRRLNASLLDIRAIQAQPTDGEQAWVKSSTSAMWNLNENKRAIIVDGLNSLSTSDITQIDVKGVILAMREKAILGILIYESRDDVSIDYLVDTIIELRKGERNVSSSLSIVKSRFQSSATDWHEYEIEKDGGVTVFCSPRFCVMKSYNQDAQLKASMTSIADWQDPELGDGSLPKDDSSVLMHLFNGEMKRASCTVVLGARRTWKTLFTFDFLRAGSRKKEPGLLVSLMGNQPSIITQRTQLCEWYCPGSGCLDNKKCYRQSYVLPFNPNSDTPSSKFFHYLDERIEEAHKENKPIKRLLLWDLTQLEIKAPLLAKDVTFLVDYLKHTHKITSVFMGAPKTKIAECVSAIADNVVFCWQDTFQRTLKGRSEISDGIAVHVDRIEGKPETGGLFFMREKISEDVKRPPCKKPVEIFRPDCDSASFWYAESMIAQIRGMQGLPAEKKG